VSVRLLLIDDDTELGDLMRQFFAARGFDLTAETSGPRGLEAALGGGFTLVILDVMLPGLDGYGLLRQLRKRAAVPVIMLTARAAEADRVAGLDAGADDYLTKPFGPDELLARVRAVLRRAGQSHATADEALTVGPVRLAPAGRSAWCREVPLPLTDTEYDILEHLVRSAGRVVTRRELMTVLHQCDFAPYDRALDVHISHLRKKLGADAVAVRTVRGEGYLFSTADA
jgi:two-component system, OmpR family, response regulator CpxR